MIPTEHAVRGVSFNRRDHLEMHSGSIKLIHNHNPVTFLTFLQMSLTGSNVCVAEQRVGCHRKIFNEFVSLTRFFLNSSMCRGLENFYFDVAF